MTFDRKTFAPTTPARWNMAMQAIAEFVAGTRKEIEAEFRVKVADLERQIQLLRTELDAVATIRATTAEALAKMDQRSAQLDRLAAQIDALLDPSPNARRTATARLRQ